ncbi:hypothetical protein C8F01DRAFT_1160654 [Mycena amicta]|nr:hypothetical protein C8F01DRAFT_1160654 [Mycena amicta]
MAFTDLVFPRELEREIFEIAGRLHPKSLPTLFRVARRVHIWLKPLLYQVMRLSTSDLEQVPGLVDMMQSEPEFLRGAVRFLCLQEPDRQKERINQLLKICSRGVDLVLLSGSLNYDLSALADMTNLRRLTIYTLPALCDVIDSHPGIFPQLTHIELSGSFGASTAENSKQNAETTRTLARLPALTHLSCASPHPISWTRVQQILDAMPRLLILALIYSPSGAQENFDHVNEGSVTDTRFVAGIFPDDGDNGWLEWEESARGTALDYWDRAEIFLRRKKKGEVEVKRFWVDDWLYGDGLHDSVP